MPGTDEYRSKIELLYEGIRLGDLSVADELIHPDYCYHGSSAIGPGPEGMKAVFQAVKDGMTDFRFVIDDFMVDGDRAISRYTIIGTHTGTFAGAPGTGNHLDYNGIAIYRFHDDMIVEEWDYFEEVKMYTDLGVLAAPEPAESG
jgi:steroid delta-isomerase-like uncharacterized protein